MFRNSFFYRDVHDAIKLKAFWLKLSWLEFYGWYGKLSLGFAWVIISPLVFSLGIGVVYSEAFGTTLAEHFLYVYGGYVCWLFIADTLGQGAEVYSNSYSYYSETKLPLIGFNVKGTLVRSYTLLLNTVTFLVVALLAGHSFNVLLCVFVVIYFLVLSTLASILLSILMAFLPDLKLVIQNLMRLLFFLTPIVWVPGDDLSGVKALLVYANPFYYVVELYRQIIGVGVNFEFWYVHAGMLSGLLIASVLVYNLFSRRMVFVCK